jgi:hypothetical protein
LHIWKSNYVDEQGYMLLVVELPPLVAFMHEFEITCAKTIHFEPKILSIKYPLPIT